jgi:hypothetical protein
MGYAVFQEVDLCTFSYQKKYERKQVTDFDVLAVLVEPDFAISVAVAECKDVEERAMEFLLKLNGLKAFFGARKAYLVQSRLDVNAREVARELGIWCLDEENLSTLMSGVGVQEKPHVQLESDIYTEKAKLFKQQKKDFPKPIKYLKYDFWTLPEHRNVINLMHQLQQISDKVDQTKVSHVVLVHQMAVNLSVALVQLTAQIVRSNINNIEDGCKTRMLGGSRERRDREALFDTLAQVLPGNGLSLSPEYLPNLAEIAARLINGASAACKIISCLDHFTRRILVPSYDDAFGSPLVVYGDRTAKLARDVLRFIVSNAKLPEAIFAASFSDNLPEKGK